jgi:hypothetical protein
LATLAELFKPRANTSVAAGIPDDGQRLTYQGLGEQIASLKRALLAGGLTPGSLGASR